MCYWQTPCCRVEICSDSYRQLNPHLTCKLIRHRNLLWQTAFSIGFVAWKKVDLNIHAYQMGRPAWLRSPWDTHPQGVDRNPILSKSTTPQHPGQGSSSLSSSSWQITTSSYNMQSQLLPCENHHVIFAARRVYWIIGLNAAGSFHYPHYNWNARL